MITIQCDEHVKNAIVKGLKARGIETYSAEDEGLKGLSDSELLKHCINTNRVLLTNDEDFLSLDKKVEHRGIIFITSQFSAIGDIIRAVVKLVDTVPEKDFKNTKFFVP